MLEINMGSRGTRNIVSFVFRFLGCVVILVTANYISQTYIVSDDSFQDTILNQTGSVLIYKDRSSIHCGLTCANMYCPSYFHNSITMECQINILTYNGNVVNSVTFESGWMFYIDTGGYIAFPI